jgi:hypothetical protein
MRQKSAVRGFLTTERDGFLISLVPDAVLGAGGKFCPLDLVDGTITRLALQALV